MAKAKSAFVCTECGADYSKWQGQCSNCREWNTLTEVRLSSPARPGSGGSAGGSTARQGYAGLVTPSVTDLGEVDLTEVPRFSSTFGEFDRVLGGGLVPGSAVLLGGSPGAGKSTLLLQVACALAQQKKVLYVTGEESLSQVAMRANRLRLPTQGLRMLGETSVETVLATAQKEQPAVLIIDSIQTMHLEDIASAPGGVAQVRESAAALTRFAKQSNTVLLLVGHVTKDGTLAGPKVLEHMIDASLLLEGDTDSRFRTLRGQKNRFGAVNELGVFAMLEHGLKEVTNPSAIFLSRQEEQAPGSVVMVVWEGTRPLLVEVQALLDESSLGNPRRVAVGMDGQRLAMLLAVLHRHGGLFTGDQDVFVNVVGGVKVLETSADLAVLLAIVSSLRNTPLPRELVVFGEVGLSGEIRPVPSGQERLIEAAKHGFTRAIAPRANIPRKSPEGMEVVAVEKLMQALDAL
ncbi:DNA repair protein RadA [Larsenimonas rhizosphaerae]|uniref:DNA repair protein RadA n=1 Tax=Larsenimonas rhizosphaerae TaxID=2944682 RepID=A0AA41ZH91_9GAMM|nr:DNA repair protein RadA [Larsenimonas rhizosphaerae]MCM2131416.1 DNA repair protein RadA [Larsenimonas rhizosphaerae]MCX2525219.1 DNA repair protein RadA [Larsenimonas rhizosphaerae]